MLAENIERDPAIVAAMMMNDAGVVARSRAIAATGVWHPLSDAEFAVLVENRRQMKLPTPSRKLARATTCAEVLALIDGTTEGPPDT